MATLTLIAGTNGHETVTRTSNESPARGWMSTSRTCADIFPSAPLTNRFSSGRETGTRAEMRVPATSRNADALRYSRMSDVSRDLCRPLMKAENPVTAHAADGSGQLVARNRL